MPRWCIPLLLLGAALAGRADGFAYGNHFQDIQETTQTAVVRVEPGAVTVDMFIVIDGIPKGETVTYVLPFWHRPDGFTLREETPRAFHNAVMQPAIDEVETVNSLTHAAIGDSAALGLAASSAGLFGPITSIVTPVFMHAREKARQGIVCDPYAVATSPHARAELFHLPARDVPALVAQAGLPPAAARALARYHTPYFAVMRLTGTGGKPGTAPTGVHYHFRHLAGAAPYTYIYPLGTGAAWSKPVASTEVYLTCPHDYTLHVTAPANGEGISYNRFTEYAFILQAQQHPDDPLFRHLGAMIPADDVEPCYSSLLEDDCQSPFAWHIGYLKSNLADDIHVELQPRHDAWRIALVLSLWGNPRLGGVLGCVGLVLAWGLATLLVFRRSWHVMGCPHTAQVWLWCAVGVSLLLALPVALLGTNFLFRPESLQGTLVGWILFLASLALPVIIAIRRLEKPIFRLLRNTWLVAAACYVLYCFAIVWLLDGIQANVLWR